MTLKIEDKERSIEFLFGAFGEDSDEREDIEKKIYTKRLVSTRKLLRF